MSPPPPLQSVGAGIDSYVEYLLKAFVHSGDGAFLAAFVPAYAAAMRHLNAPPPRDGARRPSWRVEADMDGGGASSPWVSSLAAFWPGLQALAGQTADAGACFADWARAWARFGGLPEAVDARGRVRHPSLKQYPLRPELAESAYALHAVTGGSVPAFRRVGAAMVATLSSRCAAPCGFAALADVATGAREDAMESFFLAETVKYLELLFKDGAGGLVDAAVLTTEGHPLPPLPRAGGEGAPPELAPGSPCASVCALPAGGNAAAAAATAAALPLLAPTAAEVALVRGRRCAACAAVEAAMVGVRAELEAEDASAAAAAAPAAQAVCALADPSNGGGLACASLERVPAGTSVALDGLGRGAVVVQLNGGPDATAPPTPSSFPLPLTLVVPARTSRWLAARVPGGETRAPLAALLESLAGSEGAAAALGVVEASRETPLIS